MSPYSQGELIENLISCLLKIFQSDIMSVDMQQKEAIIKDVVGKVFTKKGTNKTTDAETQTDSLVDVMSMNSVNNTANLNKPQRNDSIFLEDSYTIL